MKKSQLTGFILTLIVGPIGLFYSSSAAAIGLILLALVLGVPTMGIGAIIVWPIAILTGFYTVGKHNARVEIEEKRHRELLSATRALDHAGTED
jgi:hypothetical protein